MEKALEGDAEAFASLCNRFTEALYRYLYFRLGAVSAAEEGCVEVFVRMWETLSTDARRTTLPFTAWLFQVANDVVREQVERANQLGRHAPRPPLVAWSASEGAKGAPQLHPRFLAQALMQLDEVTQQVLTLRFVVRLSHHVVALIVGDSNTGSRVLQYRALLQLRELLTRKKMSEHAYSNEYVATATFCLDRIIAGRSGPDDFDEQIAYEGQGLRQLLDFAVIVREACNIRPRRALGRELHKKLLAGIRQSRRRPRRRARALRWFAKASGRFPMPLLASFALALALLAVWAVGTTLLLLVDHSLPGDRFYDLDLRLERAYHAFLTDPDSKVQFTLGLTNERLDEAELLAQRGDAGGLQVALVAYSIEVADLALQSEAVDNGYGAHLDAHFAGQQQRLDRILVAALAASANNGQGQTAAVVCEAAPEATAGDTQWHPLGLTLAAQHQVDYGDVMSWVCAGHSFGEIVLALATIESGELPASEVMSLKAQLGGWGQLWKEIRATD